jgi:magnesium chelatase family protein
MNGMPLYGEAALITRVKTVAFQGIEILEVDVQAQIVNGMPGFAVVGLPDKAVGESRERVRAALHSLGLALPPKRITINLAPADVLKEGGHFDLPIALALLGAMEVLGRDDLGRFLALGELALDGTIGAVAGVLPAAVHAATHDLGVICAAASGPEAAWGGQMEILAARDLLTLINHFKGTQLLSPPRAGFSADEGAPLPDLRDVKGQETAKRALEIAAAGGHNLSMLGPPGAGKSMMAARLPSLLPPLDAREALEVSMIHSVAGLLKEDGLVRRRPFRDPHHSASLAALVGGGMRPKPGEISLAHHGVLFLDELPEFNRATLEALRQPLETGYVVVARANHHITYPARFQLVTAMNPCKCGYLGNPALCCNRAPKCAPDYQSRISGPLLDRIDMHVEVEAVKVTALAQMKSTEDSATVAARVRQARERQLERGQQAGGATINSQAAGDYLDAITALDPAAQSLLDRAAEQFHLSARGYSRIRRVARTIADLEGSEATHKIHIAEAISYRRAMIERMAA